MFKPLMARKKQSMPIFEVRIECADGRETQPIEFTGSKMDNFTTVKRPTQAELKEKYPYIQGKAFYTTATEEYPIDVIQGDPVYCQIKTESVLKEIPDEQIVEGSSFGWVVHNGKDYTDGRCMLSREISDYEHLYTLDVLGIENRGEDDQFDVYQNSGRYEASSLKVRMVLDGSARPHPLANSINECMHTGPPLQPLLWDI